MAEALRLDHLEPEILAMICEYVDDTSPRTTLSVALTCKYLASVVKLIAHRHKTIHIHAGRNEYHELPSFIQKWAQDDAILAHMRSLTVDGNLPHISHMEIMLENTEFWKPLTDLISNLSRLRMLTWNLPGIPIFILDALHSRHPHAKLRLFKYQPSLDFQPSRRDKAVAESPALTHLRSVLRPQLTFAIDMQEIAFRRIVKLAPLEYAGIVNHIGDPVAGEPNKKLPFASSKKPNSSIKVLTLDGYNMSKETLEDWSSIVDLTGLENVKCSRGFPELSYFESAPSMLPNLKHVSLNFRQLTEGTSVDRVVVEAVQQYLKACSPLETLSLWSWYGVVNLEDILDRHGPTLRSLQLHEREVPVRNSRRNLLTADQLKNILSSCPKLKDITLDLDRHASVLKLKKGDANLKYFDLLQSSGLDHIQIYFDAGLPYINNQPYLSDGDSSGDEDGNDEEEEEEGEENDEVDEEDEDEDDDEEEEEEDEQADGDEAAEVEVDVTGDSGISGDGSGEHSAPTVMRRKADHALTEPPAKRRKQSNPMIAPSKEQNMRSYVGQIWKKLFTTSLSARKLDVKFGEWESVNRRRNTAWTLLADNEAKCTRFFMARPAERDDERGQCIITRKMT